MDIRSTIANVCRKVTRDRGQCSEEILLQRCQALKLLGEYFLARGVSAETGLKDLKSKLKQQHGGADAKEEGTAEAGDAKPAADATDSKTTVPTPSAPPAAKAQESTDLD